MQNVHIGHAYLFELSFININACENEMKSKAVYYIDFDFKPSINLILLLTQTKNHTSSSLPSWHSIYNMRWILALWDVLMAWTFCFNFKLLRDFKRSASQKWILMMSVPQENVLNQCKIRVMHRLNYFY